MTVRRVGIRTAADSAVASMVARELAEGAGLSKQACYAFATATSELTTNIVKYGERGWFTGRVLAGPRPGVEAVIEDRGPGILDLEQALLDHVSSGGSLGLGLPGTRRLVDEFEIRSTKEAGTWVRVVKYR